MDVNMLATVLDSLKVDERGNSALHHAVQRKNLKLVRMLVVEVGENPCLQNKAGVDCVETAIELDWVEAFQFFMEHVRPGDQEYHKSLLLLAAKHKAHACTDELLKELGINCRIEDKPFIHHALSLIRHSSDNDNYFNSLKQAKYISFILEKEPEIKDDTGHLFVMSLQIRDINICEKFLSATDPNAIYGGEPLLVHAMKHSLNVAKKLIEAGADPNLRGTDGLPALLHCYDDDTKVDFLLSLPDIDVTVMDNYGNNILFYIFTPNNSYYKIASVHTRDKYFNIVNKLLMKGININHKNKNNMYFVSRLIEYGKNKGVVYFINKLISTYGLNKECCAEEESSQRSPSRNKGLVAKQRGPSRCGLM